MNLIKTKVIAVAKEEVTGDAIITVQTSPLRKGSDAQELRNINSSGAPKSVGLIKSKCFKDVKYDDLLGFLLSSTDSLMDRPDLSAALGQEGRNFILYGSENPDKQELGLP